MNISSCFKIHLVAQLARKIQEPVEGPRMICMWVS